MSECYIREAVVTRKTLKTKQDGHISYLFFMHHSPFLNIFFLTWINKRINNKKYYLLFVLFLFKRTSKISDWMWGCITNGDINNIAAVFFVWLYWNKLLIADELYAYWYRSINNYWPLCLVKFHQASLCAHREIEPWKERERDVFIVRLFVFFKHERIMDDPLV